MSKRISMAMAVLGAVGTLTGCNLEQPTAGCFVQDASPAAGTVWQAKYVLRDQSQQNLSCGKFTGETMGVYKYTNPDAPADVINRNEASRIAIRPTKLAALYRTTYTRPTGKVDDDGEPILETVTIARADPATASNATSLSTTLARQPDAEGLCLATGFNTATVSASAAYKKPEDGGALLKPAEMYSYSYENVEVYSAPSAPGTQLRGTVKINDGTCTAEYEMWALWPSASCDPATPVGEDNCGPSAGVNPDFDVVCDAVLKKCVPAHQPPSFK
jgi:hypothetical protein